jgi:4-amino-4-deoxy-L-arabinose transferase-like glycosyltransferase
VWVIAGSVVTLLLLVAGRYGFHRDELYFIAAGRRLAWGYIDQPPLTPLIARLADLLPGAAGAFLLRIVPALAIGMLVVMGAEMSRRFGAGRFAMTFTAFAVAGGGFFLATGHLLATSTFDTLFWAALILVVVWLIDGVDPRWWLVAGAVAGVGLLNKHLIAFLAVALLVGLVATPQRALLASRWPWIGAGIAALIALPNVVWQAQNGWPQLEMAEALRAKSDGPIAFVLLQLIALSFFLAIPAAVGFVRLWRSRWRAIPIAYAVLFLTFVISDGKFYYLAPMYVPLLAAGARWVEKLTTARRRTVIALAGVGIVVMLPFALPLAPAANAGLFNEANDNLGETMGWPQLIDQVAAVYESMPDAGREGAVIFTGNYGEAGAIELLGADRGLPPVMSGHNNYWLWGPVAGEGPIIGVGPVEHVLGLVCDEVVTAATIENPHGIDNEEHGYPILLCPDPDASLATVWDQVGHYN